MPNWIRQHARLAWLVGLLAVAGVVVASVAASASNSPQSSTAGSSSASTGTSSANISSDTTAHPVSHQYASVLPIRLTSAGFQLTGPNPRQAGPVTLKLSTNVSTGNYFYTLRLRGNTTIADVAKWSGEVNSPDLSVELQAAHNLYRYVDYTGGVALYPDTPGSITLNLTPGTYYLYDAAAFNDDDAAYTGHRPALVQTMAAMMPAASTLNELQVIGSSGSQPPAGYRKPHIDGVINLVMRDGQPRFQIPATLPGTGNFLVRSTIDQPAEAIFREVPAGYTDAQLQTYFNAIRYNQHPQPPNPLGDSPGGVMTISPGNSAIVHLHFPAGTYAVLSFLEDPSNGVHRAYEGLHEIIRMR